LRGAGALSALPAVQADVRRGRLENEFVRLVARRDGRIDLYDKPTRTWYRGLHAFEDCGDAGEGWNHIYPTRDTRVLSTNAAARGPVRVTLERCGPLSASLKMAFALRVPADRVVDVPSANQRTAVTSRSRRLVRLPIATVFTLQAGSRRIDCRTTVNNTARCHRLRVLLPTHRRTDVWFGDTAFDTVKRPIRLRDTTGWNEHDREECPIKNFAAACDRRAGLAVLTKGLYEAAVQDNASRSLALTLFRGFVEDLFFEQTKDSLLLGELAMEYALLPFTPEGGEPPAGLYAEVDRYKLPLSSYTRPASGAPTNETVLPPCSEANPPQPAPSLGTEIVPLSAELKALIAARPQPRRDLPPAGWLLKVDAPVAVSAVKQAERGHAVVVRVWNPASRSVKAGLTAGFAFQRASQADLLEQPTKRLAVRGRALRLTLRAKEILTLRFDR